MTQVSSPDMESSNKVMRIYMIIGLASLFLNQCTSASPNEARLLDELLGRSDDTFVHVRPAVQDAETVDVFMEMAPYTLVSLDDDGVLTMNLMLRMHWQAEIFVWDPESYGRITEVHVNPDKLWKPDITVLNGLNPDYVIPKGSTVDIVSSGGVSWFPLTQFKVQCSPSDMGTTTWHCVFHVGSLAHHGGLINLKLFDDSSNGWVLYDYYESHRFSILRAWISREVTTYPGYSIEFPIIKFEILIQTH